MENDTTTIPSYWSSVLIAALISALIYFIFALIGGYMIINSEPTGSLFNPASLVPTLGCLIAAVGGVFANWHYAKTYDLTYKIGKGAVIGLLTGVIAAVIATVFSFIWDVVDPAYTQNSIESQIANLEAMQNMPPEMVDAQAESMRGMAGTTGKLIGLGVGALSLGIVNLISGLVGAKVFASEE